MRRALASSLLSLLLATVLVWGGCVSCENFFMWPAAKTCCTADGHCKTKAPASKQTTAQECKQIAFDHNQSIDLHYTLPVVFDGFKSIASLVIDPRLSQVLDQATATHSPPDLQILHSIFIV